VQVEKGDGIRIFSRATDRGGNSQTQERSQWNIRAVGYNGYEIKNRGEGYLNTVRKLLGHSALASFPTHESCEQT
jgi:hypothetical protein